VADSDLPHLPAGGLPAADSDFKAAERLSVRRDSVLLVKLIDLAIDVVIDAVRALVSSAGRVRLIDTI
jgi:hypothetical protein